MASVTYLGSFYMNSTSTSSYCNSIVSEYERIFGYPLEKYHCIDNHYKNKLPLILGLSIGLGVPFILAVVCYTCWRRWKTKKAKELAANAPPEYKMGDLLPYTADRPPMYGDSGGAQGSESGGADVADVAVARTRVGRE